MNKLQQLLGAAVCGSALLGSMAQAGERELKVYNWFDYITPETLTKFKQDSQLRTARGAEDCAPEVAVGYFRSTKGLFFRASAPLPHHWACSGAYISRPQIIGCSASRRQRGA